MKHFSSPLVIKSFAKLNLYLQVLNKRQDNFHNLSTLFARIDLADTIILREGKEGLIRIQSDNPNVPENETNLCFRAAELLKQALKLDFALDIEIKKRIPVGAGLGGGSSNAASVLLGLNKYWNLNLSKTRLANLGVQLGSDVPFFIHDTKFALGSQRGDRIKPLTSLNKLKLWFILVYPNVSVSTPLIYREFDNCLFSKRLGKPAARACLSVGRGFSQLTRPWRNVKILTSELLKKGYAIDPRCLFNDLEVITTRLYPVVIQVKNTLADMGLERVMMSGSGPAVFAICRGRLLAQDLSSELRKKHKSWQVFVSSVV
jgi:4-diphosphocytidyl-2-C-methyl-D-erythritol kinase